MTITTKTEANKIIVELEGRLDTNTAPELEKELGNVLSGGRKNIVLDFANLVYVSSAGLRVLLSAQKKVNDFVSTMVIRNVNDTIMEVFELTGFSEFLTIEKFG